MAFKGPFQPKAFCDPMILAISRQKPFPIVASQLCPGVFDP